MSPARGIARIICRILLDSACRVKQTVSMPRLNRERSIYRMGRRGFRDAKELAVAVELPHWKVRNGVYGHDQLNLVDIFTLAKALREPNETVDAVVEDILAGGDGTPDLPPEKKTKDTQGPARRQDTEKRSGPKRAAGRAVA